MPRTLYALLYPPMDEPDFTEEGFHLREMTRLRMNERQYARYLDPDAHDDER